MNQSSSQVSPPTETYTSMRAPTKPQDSVTLTFHRALTILQFNLQMISRKNIKSTSQMSKNLRSKMTQFRSWKNKITLPNWFFLPSDATTGDFRTKNSLRTRLSGPTDSSNPRKQRPITITTWWLYPPQPLRTNCNLTERQSMPGCDKMSHSTEPKR